MNSKITVPLLLMSLLLSTQVVAGERRIETQGKCRDGSFTVEKVYDGDNLVEYTSRSYDGKLSQKLFFRDGVYSGEMVSAEVHTGKGVYKEGMVLPPGMVKKELEIINLDERYRLAKDEKLREALNEAKREAIKLYLEVKELPRFKYSSSGEHMPLSDEEKRSGIGNARSMAERYARDIYEFYLNKDDKETLNLIKELVGYESSQDYVGDEQYLRSPYELSLLKRQSVIIKNDDKGEVIKVYFYNESGNLIRICMPQKETVLFIQEYGKLHGCDYGKMQYGHFSIYNIWGGKFDNFNLDYPGGAGLSDMAVQSAGITELARVTKNSLSQLKKAIMQYKEEFKQPLDEAKFSLSVNLDHPLMAVEGMNLEYFFDGHGSRIIYKKAKGNDFTISSKYEKVDFGGQRGARINSWFLNSMFLIPLLLVCVFIFVLGKAIWSAIFLKTQTSGGLVLPPSLRFISLMYGPMGILASITLTLLIPILLMFSPIIVIGVSVFAFIIGKGLMKLKEKFISLAIIVSVIFIITNSFMIIRTIGIIKQSLEFGHFSFFSLLFLLPWCTPILLAIYYIVVIYFLLKSSIRKLFFN